MGRQPGHRLAVGGQRPAGAARPQRAEALQQLAGLGQRGGRRGPRGRGRFGVGLELPQAVVEIHVKILLPLDGVGQVVAEDFVLAAQAGDLGLQLLDLVGEFELGAGAGFELADAAVELVAHLVDAHAGFLVVKQAGVGLAGGKADEQAGHQGGQKAGEHQNSPE